MMNTDPAKYSPDDLLTLVTWMYYEDGMTHQEVAEALSLSRVAVTRMLQKARQQQLVRFQITRPRPAQYVLSRALTEQFELQRAIVVKTAETLEETLEAVASAAACHLQESLYPGCRLGVGWSSTLQRMATYLTQPVEPLAFTVNEMAGSLPEQEIPGRISIKIAETLGGRLISLPVPVVVSSKDAYNTFLKEPLIAQGLLGAAQCDLAFVGIGDVGPDCTMIRTGYIKPDDLEALRQRGAVGDMLLRYYNINGEHVPTTVEDTVFTLRWEQMKALPYVVALAAGPRKVVPILGALRTGILDCLVTDSDTARGVLSLNSDAVSEE